MRRRLWMKILVLLIVVLVVAAWYIYVRNQNIIYRKMEQEEVSITLLASKNWIKDIDRELFDEFERETGIRIQVLLTPNSGYESLVGTCLAGGNGEVDMFMFPMGTMLSSMGIEDIALNLSQEPWVNRLEGWAREASSCSGKVLGFPTWGLDYEGILYNKTFFKEHHLEVPGTWKEFLTLCDQIRSLGTVPLYEALNDTWHTQCWVYGLTPMLYRENPDFVEELNKGSEYKLEDLLCLQKGMEQIQQLFSKKENGIPKYYVGDGREEEFPGSYSYLTQRKAVMMFTYSAYASELKDYGSQDEWGMFPVPLLDNQTAVSNGGGMAKFINKNSEHIEECKQLLYFLAKDENLERYYAARKDLVTSAFQGIESVQTPQATREILRRSKGKTEVMFTKDVFYLDPKLYQYIQELADGTAGAQDAIRKLDEYRAKMFHSKDTPR